MKLTLSLLLTILFLSSCTSVLTPKETLDKSIKASQEGDAETRWELSSQKTREKLMQGKTKEEVLENFRKGAFYYKFIKSWESEITEQTENQVKMKMKYKFFDPHSKKVIDQSTDVNLVKEEGVWRIDDKE